MKLAGNEDVAVGFRRRPRQLQPNQLVDLASRTPLISPALTCQRDCRLMGNQGFNTIRVPSGTTRQISSISRSVTATHPSVQSTRRCSRPSQPHPFFIP